MEENAQTEVLIEARKRFLFDPPASDEQLSLIGFAVAKWACIEAEMAQIAHGLANGDQKLWNAFHLARDFAERREFINEHSKQLRDDCAYELRTVMHSAESTLKQLQKLLNDCWSRPSGWITLCAPARPQRWEPHFPIGHWKLKNQAIVKVLRWIDETHLKIHELNARYADPHDDGEITSSISIRRMFANVPEQGQ